MRILFLSRWYPHPPDNGSKIRIFNMLRSLCELHSVTLISFFDPEEEVAVHTYPRPSPEEIIVCPYREFNPRSNRALLGYMKRQPRWLADTYSADMAALIRSAAGKSRYELIIASQTSMASYYGCFNGIPAIFEEVELGCFRPCGAGASESLTRWRQQLTWAKHRRFLADLLPHFRLCTVASEMEREWLTKAVPGFRPVYVIPNGIDLGCYDQTPIERVSGSLIFAGSLRYTANLDAITWFLRDIYPILRSEREDIGLKITGAPGPDPLPAAPNVVLTGRVPDVHRLIAESMVSVAPIRIGGGTRLKILESFALGTAVVATSKAVEGLEVRNGEHLLLADTPREFARSVLRLLEEPEEARQLASRAFELLRVRYDWRTLFQGFQHLLHQAAHS